VLLKSVLATKRRAAHNKQVGTSSKCQKGCAAGFVMCSQLCSQRRGRARSRGCGRRGRWCRSRTFARSKSYDPPQL